MNYRKLGNTGLLVSEIGLGCEGFSEDGGKNTFPMIEAAERLGINLLGLDSDTFYIYHVAAVMVDNLRRLLLGINLSDKAIMDFDFPGVGFPV